MPSQIPPRARILFRRLTPFGLIVAAVYRLRGHSVSALRVSPALAGPGGRVWLRRLGIDELNLADLPFKSGYTIMEVRCRLSRLAMEVLFPRDMAFLAVLEAFEGVTAPEKVKIVVYDRLYEQLGDLARFVAVAQGLAALDGAWPRLFASLSGLERWVLRLGHPELVASWPALLATLGWAGLLLGRAIRALPPLVTTLHRAPAKPAAPERSPVQNQPDSASFEVLFFPHQSPLYGNLFLKDYYYDPDPSSPLASRNVLHVEYGRAHLEASLDYYRKNCLPHAVLSLGFSARLAGHAVKSALALAGRARLIVPALGKKPAIGLGLLLFALTAHRHYRDAVSPFTSARLAIVGYDYLFPKSLAVALQSRGIKVVAAQERFIQTFYPQFAAIFDTYLVTGPRVVRHLTESPFCHIGELKALGCPRADLLAEAMATATPETVPRVLVLDFHSPPHADDSRLNPISNWENNKAFYRDILRLARRFPKAHFTIRGKDDVWRTLPFFEDVVSEMESLPNIKISKNFIMLNESYRLAAGAVFILARHTSLADEALALGRPVLFHDYAQNWPTLVSSLFDYDNYPVFAHDYQTMESRLGRVLAGEDFMPAADFQRLREEYYCAGQGPVRERLLSELRALLARP